MKFLFSRIFFSLVFILFVGFSLQSNAQTSVSTVGVYSNNNGSGQATFNVQNTNTYPIQITSISDVIPTGSVAVFAYYKASPILAVTPGPTVNTANGWTQIGSGTTTNLNASTLIPNVIFGGTATSTFTPVTIPAGSTYGFSVGSASSGYFTIPSGGQTTFSAGGVNMLFGTNISWGAGTPPAAPVNTPRGMIGGITFVPVGPCTSPPTAGTTSVSSTNLCSNSSLTLNVVGGTGGTGQTFQWQSGPSASGPWTNIGPNTAASQYTFNVTSTAYYQCIETCGGLNAITNPVQVTIPALFPAGTYTINKLIAASSTNFTSFGSAINAIACGTTGPIVFNVVAGTGPYTEQVVIPQINTNSAVNAITFNGNGNTLTYAATLATSPSTLELNGADFINVNNLIVSGTGATYALVCHLWNQADNNIFTGCTFNAPANTTSTTCVPFSLSGSQTVATTAGTSGNNNKLDGCTMFSGYYNTCFVGNSAAACTGNQVINCNLRDQYFYASYNLYQNGLILSGNTIERPTRTTLSTFYGIYLSTGMINTLIEKNRIRNPYGAAITNTGSAYGIYDFVAASLGNENKIYNNIISDFNCNGAIYGMYLSGGTYTKIYHNTISFDQTAASGTTTTYGIYLPTTGVIIKNNIITITRGGITAKYGLYLTGAGAVSNNNDIYVNGTGNNVGYYSLAYATLTTWKTANASAYDQQSISVDPIYTAPITSDYTPSGAGATAINDIGQALGITSDILNVLRSATTPDPGAYEFNVGGCSGTPTAGTTSSTINPACPNTNFTLFLTGTSLGSGLTYQWESSPDDFTWTPISGATSSTLTTNHVTSTYYHCIVICNGGFQDVSASVLVVTTAIPLSGLYTINSGAATGGTNYQSFTALAAALNCAGVSGPVTVDVVTGSGPYTEQVEFTQFPGSSASNTLTINGNGNTLTFANGTAAAPHTLMLTGTDYMSVNNLIVEGTNATYALACHLWNDANNNTFTGCTFNVPANCTSSIQVPFSLSGSPTSATTSGPSGNNNIIDGCTMFSGYYNTCIVGNSGLVNTGNQVKNSNLKDYYLYGSYNLYNNGTVISNNIIERPTRTTLSTFYGVYVSTGCTNMLVEKNRIRRGFGSTPNFSGTAYCIYDLVSATAGNENKFYNNVISDFTNNGGIYGMYLTGASYVKVYHNTISMDYAASVSTGTVYGIYATGAAGIDIKNNNISITQGGASTKYCLYFTFAGTLCNYNNLYMNAPAGTNVIGYYLVNYSTLAAWQAANSLAWDQQSVSSDPLFVAAGSYDYTPNAAAVNDLGTPLAAVTTDINNVTRSTTTPDMGAYEFSVLTCNGTPNNGTALASLVNACGDPFTLTLSGASLGAGITYQWQSAPAGSGNWTNLGPSSLSYSYSTTQTVATDYQCITSCSNGGFPATSSTVSVGQNPYTSCYCTPVGTGTTYYITNFTTTGGITNINNTSVLSTNGYGDYTTTVPAASATPGTTLGFTVTYVTGTHVVGVWADWNHDGDFNDASETCFITGTYQTSPYSNSFTVPMFALAGNTRMRVRTLFISPVDPCSTSIYGEAEDYTFNVIPLNPCAGAPDPATILGTTSACVGVNYTLSLSTSYPFSNMTYQWQSSPDNITYTNIAGATSLTSVVSPSTPTYYQCLVTCTNSGQTMTTPAKYIAITPATQCYCIPVGTGTSYYITNFTTTGGVTNINNTSGLSTNGYGDYSTSVPAASAVVGTVINFTATYVTGTHVVGVWIDWNQDGDFNDVNETCFITTTYQTSPFSSSFTVPAGALPGSTRMRVRTLYISPVDPCSTSIYGEAEDYTFNVIGPCTNSNPGTIVSSTLNPCEGTTQVITATVPVAQVGTTYQWKSSTVSGGPYTNVVGGSGATTSSYTTSASTPGTVFYVLETSCANCGPCSSLSNEATVTTLTVPAPIATNSSQCGPGIPTASVATNGIGGNGSFFWYNAATGGTLVQSPPYGPLQTYYTNNFSTAVLTNSSISDNAVITGGVLQLTPAVTLSQAGGLTVNASGYNSDKYQVDFDITTGANGLADGLSYSFSDDGSATSVTPTPAEIGTGSKLRIGFDAYGAGVSAAGIYLIYGTTIAGPGQTVGTNGILGYSSDISWIGVTNKHAKIEINAAGQVKLTVGSTVIFNNVQLPTTFASTDKSAWTHIIKARSGGVAGAFAIDNLVIQASNTVAGTPTFLQSISATTTGYVSEKGTNGCMSPRTPITATVNPLVTAGITNNTGASVISCANTSINVTATGGTSYAWSGGSTPTTAANSFTSASTYTVTATGVGGCSSTATIAITGTPCATTLNLKFYIQGYYLGAGTMTSTIQNEDLDPITAPNYASTDCDSVTITLHEDNSSTLATYPTIGTYTGMLHTDGTISCTFPGSTLTKSCYIVIEHRNSIQTWSSLPITIASINSYDFSTAATKALGSNQIDVASEGIYSIYNGDINLDFATDASDFLIMDADIQSFNSGYINTDLNGDGATDASDFLILDGNIQSFIGAIILP